MVDENYSQERALLKQINEFNKIYKKKSKKERRSSINTSELFKVPEKRLKTVSDY